MPQKYSGRVLLIVAILLLALLMIFPINKVFDSSIPFSQKLNLKPGIDIAGGTSLLYEIKPPDPDKAPPPDLAERVMASLKKRVDPFGLRNLIWRPQGKLLLEIQMPANALTAEAGARRTAFAEAQRQLEDTNVRTSQVIRDVESHNGAELNRLAMGSATRQKLFDSLQATYKAELDARAAKNADLDSRKQDEFDALQQQIDSTNLSVASLQDILDASVQTRQKALGDLKSKFADFPKRLAAIDNFVTAYDAYSKVKGAIDDAGELKRQLKGSGVLEFHILVTDMGGDAVEQMKDRMRPPLNQGPAPQAGDTMRWFQADRPDEFRHGNAVTAQYNDKLYVLSYTTPEKSMVHREGQPIWALRDARGQMGDDGQEVAFEFDTQGGSLFGKLTSDNTHKPLAIVLDGKIISAPNINTPILSGQGVITGGGAGGFSTSDLNYLVNTLNAGSLPAQLGDEPVSERTIKPQLGEDNLRAGLVACVFGLIVVAVFLIGYYYLAGVIAFGAVSMNLVLILGALAALNATFTLPSIAGIVLTVGTAVDANVLIFERLREEQHRGLSLRMALRNAYDRAFSAIVDSNATTAITSVVLYWIGSEEVKGFGLTLLIGIVCSLFTALFVTRTVFGLLIDKGGLKKLGSLPLTFPKWDKFLKPNIDWMGMAWIFYAFSVVAIGVGTTMFVLKYRAGKMLDIEFSSGTQVQFELKDPIPLEQMRKMVAKADPVALPSPSIVAVGNNQSEYEIITPGHDSRAVKQQILSVLGDHLKVELPSRFDQVGQPLAMARDKVLFPIRNGTVKLNGWSPAEAANYDGGVAILLDHLDPPLRPSQVRQRIERQRLQPQVGAESQTGYQDFTVVSETGNDEPTATALVLASDQALPYDRDPGKWEESLAGPMWSLVNDAVDHPAQLEKVNNFSPQVATDTEEDAVMALTVSVLIIMAYIWLRFGNLKYGTATVVALMHDTIFTVAALGFAHYMTDSDSGIFHAISSVFGLEPFRINLTVVAGILTIMSYSMIDTIVVFDRIRENRGKYGHLSRRVINDAINQTLSRTLLTAGTTIVTVSFMYFLGGEGIHGFTFVLLVGILVGTYSSVAIAAPLLLWGVQSETAEKEPPVGQLQRAG